MTCYFIGGRSLGRINITFVSAINVALPSEWAFAPELSVRRQAPCNKLLTAAVLYFLFDSTGGKTRVLAGPKSEGESYYFVADHYDWWGKPDLRARASTEDFARDSFENILFSICRYAGRHFVGVPERLMVVPVARFRRGYAL